MEDDNSLFQPLPNLSHPVVMTAALPVFRCQSCDKVAPPRTKAFRVVVASRPATYPFREDANRFARTNDRGTRKVKLTHDLGGSGTEIKREVTVCASCLELHRK